MTIDKVKMQLEKFKMHNLMFYSGYSGYYTGTTVLGGQRAGSQGDP